MPVIHVLSPHVADLIAAGEVVERPASAVKELLENAVDAGARTVVLELRAGGRDYIRVTDDGVGMAPEDAGICFLRHATSKLSDERGLEAIGTLGFRGEALAAISAVSRITLTTRRRGAAMGVRVEAEAGEIVSMEETGCPEGTTITVRDLFYNTPARQKFLGTDRSEGAACVQSALRTALGRPDVSFRCLRDGQEEFFSPGDGTAKSAVYALLGRDTAAGLLPVDTESDGVAVKGFVSAPGCCRGNRSAQYFFCNGRPIRSRALQAALEQAYKNTAMVGRFPGCVLYITLPNGLVDVNVHPTKAEVKFAKEKPVFDGVYYGTLAALGRKSAPQAMSNAPFAPEAKSAAPVSSPARPAPAAASAPRGDFFRTMDADTFRQTYAASPSRRTGGYPVRDSAPYRAASPAAPKAASPESVSAPVRTYTPDIPSGNAPRSPVPAPETPVSPAIPAAPVKKEIPAPETAETAPEQTVLDEAFRAEPVRYIGEALNVYILLEQGDRLLLIDKHAAHERILFDKMRLNEKPLMPQELLEPQPFNTDPDGAALLEENAALMARLGFALDAFGDTAFLIRAVPAQLDAASAVPLLEELVEKLREGRSLSVSDVWERLAATVACKAAIKGGWVTEREELLSLAEKVLAGEVTHCPHGRPVMTVFTRAELDKRFGRIV
ncbi:MAG: DNA mismatch repair endonuclease MutL [Oscillospiraceae bacterium]